MREASYILPFFMGIGIYILKLLHEIPKFASFEAEKQWIGIYIPQFLYKIPNIEKNWNPRMKKLARESNIMENQGKNQKNWKLTQEKFRLESNSIKLGNKTTR